MGTVKLGPLSAKLLTGSQSTGHGHDKYPAFQEWANELEKLLEYAVSQNQFERFANRISKGRAHQRDEAIAELRAAFFLSRNGFPIIQWDPPGASGTVGEFLLDAKDQPVFVEVKSPGWEAELSPDEIKAGRTKEPKYVQGDARAVAPWLQTRECIKRAYHKFTDNQLNLLLIADDFHVSLVDDLEQVKIALFEPHKTVFGGEPGYFTNSARERLGGVALFGAHLMDWLGYSFIVFANPFALKETRLPKSLQNLKVEERMFEIGDTVKVISSGEIRHVTGTRDPDMYETQISMDAGTKWIHKGSELQLLQKAPKPLQEPGFIPERGIMD